MLGEAERVAVKQILKIVSNGSIWLTTESNGGLLYAR
jgi:hypothetical protein